MIESTNAIRSADTQARMSVHIAYDQAKRAGDLTEEYGREYVTLRCRRCSETWVRTRRVTNPDNIRHRRAALDHLETMHGVSEAK